MQRHWTRAAHQIRKRLSEENFSILAAGVAYYGLLAIFPALAAIVAIYGLICDPHQIPNQVNALHSIMPAQAVDLIAGQLQNLAASSKSDLSIGLIVAVVLSIYSASQATSALMTALNVSYRCQDTRGFLKRFFATEMLTVGGVIFMVVSLLLIVAVPPILHFAKGLGVGQVARIALDVARWLLLCGWMALGLSLLFRYVPDRHPRRWRPLGWGSIIGAILWIIASLLFSYYVANFGSINKTYGSIGAVVVLLMWFYVTAYIVIFAATAEAEVNYQISPEQVDRHGAAAKTK